MAGKDDTNLVRTGQGLVEFLGGAARVCEDNIDAFPNETLDDDVGAFHFTADFGLGKRGGGGGRFHGDTWVDGNPRGSREPGGEASV